MKKIILISIFFLLAVFLSVEKASALSCGPNGAGTCVDRSCLGTEDFNGDATFKQCNVAGGPTGSENCCIPNGKKDAACCRDGSSAAVYCNSGFKADPVNTCPESNRKCCIPETGSGTGGAALGDPCDPGIPNYCASGLSCVEAGVGGNAYYYCANMSGNSTPPSQTSSGNSTPPSASALTGTGVVIPTNTGLADPPGGIAQILDNLLMWLLGIVGIIALIGFVISGIQYVISTGDETMMERAKRNMMYSIAGIAVALSGVVVVMAINSALEARWWF